MLLCFLEPGPVGPNLAHSAIVVNKVLLQHSHSHLAASSLWLLYQHDSGVE